MSKVLRKRMKPSKIFLVMALCFMIMGTTIAIPVKAFVGEISNDILSLKVQEDPEKSAYAGFMLTKAGEELPEYLTYSKFYSSYTTITINGVAYRYSQGEVVKEISLEDDGSVSSVQCFDGVEVTQKLKFVAGNTSKEDMLLVSYLIDNKTDNEVLISARIVLDPTLSNQETDMIQVEGKSYNVETTFSDVEVPDEWCIKDSNGNIAVYGILNQETVKPDQFQIVDWKNIYDNTAQYITSKNEVVEDNAVAICWDNKTIKAGEDFNCATKYGLYSAKEENTTEENTTGTVIKIEPVTDESNDPKEEIETTTVTEEETTENDKAGYDTSNISPKTGDMMKLSAAMVMFIATGVCMALYIYWETKERREKC